jgi:CheY-like chemotaxis protein
MKNHSRKKTNASPDNARRWMLVDDNVDILMMLASVAEHFTTSIVECYSSPQSALVAYAASPGKYELVITDFEMPGMDGVDLCRRFREISPSQKIFLTTGTGFFTDESAQRAGFDALLNKPFPLTALQEALAAAGLENECACAVRILHPINNRMRHRI